MKRFKRNQSEDNFDLDLAPMLAMIVALIPILLLSFTFFKVKIIETNLPQPVAEELAKKQKKKKRQISIELRATQKRGFEFRIKNGNKIIGKKKIRNKKGKLDFARLHKESMALKSKYPEVFRLQLYPGKNLAYEQIVKIMDNVRKDDKKEFTVKDKDGKRQKTNLIFPDVIFADLLEG